MNARPATSKLGNISWVANAIRAGASVNELAAQRQVNPRTLDRALREAGFDGVTGIRSSSRTLGGLRPLVESAGGSAADQCTTMLDHPDILKFLPITEPVRYAENREKPRGLDWAAISPEPAPARARLVPAGRSGGSASDRTPTRAKRSQPHPGGRKSKLSEDQRATMVARYNSGESAKALGAEYDVGAQVVLTAVTRAGHPVRSKAEAIRLRFEQREHAKKLGTPETILNAVYGQVS
jgi:hypothetical protein